MPILLRLVILLVICSAVVTTGCGSDPDKNSQTSESQSEEQESTAPDEQEPATPDEQEIAAPDEQETDGAEFDIGNRRHAAARLTILHGILSDGNPVTDPVGWAKAGAAGIRIEEICNNFEIDEALDPACDQLLLALETPFNQVSPLLTAAANELRQVISRRDLADVEAAALWDADIVEFEFEPDMVATLRSLKSVMQRCAAIEASCDNWSMSEAIAGFAAQRFVLLTSTGEDDTVSLIALVATSDLFDRITEFQEEASDFGKSLDAQYIVEELEDIGVY